MTMKVLVLGKATEQSESGEFGDPEAFGAMDQYTRQLTEAGIMLAADGLQPSSEGKRVNFDANGSARGIDGPFAEAKELVAGYMIWEVSSMDEAVEWAKRSPTKDGVIELRKILDLDDFGDFAAEITAAEERARAGAAS